MAYRLTLLERAQVASQFEVSRSVIQVQRWWRQMHGPHVVLNPKTIRNCHAKLMTMGSVSDTPRRRRPSTARAEENVRIVRDIFVLSPQKSTRNAAIESGLPRHTIRTVLKKDLGFRPWKPHYCQWLSLEDCDRRMEFGESMLGWHAEWPDLFDNIIWSDEAVFHVGGFVNRHNSHYWASEDPLATVEKMQSRPNVTVWCGMTSSKVIGPFLIRNTMNGERYLEMLRDQVWPIVSQWDNAADLIFMHDGAPPHFARPVREWLDQHFPQHWIGRQGPQEWPARSPDLTPCDFFLWGWAKEQVYRAKPGNLDELEAEIEQVFANVTQEFLRNAANNVPTRLAKLVANAGAYVEF